jgi:hypothetical protein
MKEYNEKLLFDNLGKAENNKLAFFHRSKISANYFVKTKTARHRID